MLAIVGQTEYFWKYSELRSKYPLTDGFLGVPFMAITRSQSSSGLDQHRFCYVRDPDDLLLILKQSYWHYQKIPIYETLNGSYAQKFRLDIDIMLKDETGQTIRSRQYCDQLKKEIIDEILTLASEYGVINGLTNFKPVMDEYQTIYDNKYSTHLVSFWSHENSRFAYSLYLMLIDRMSKKRADDKNFLDNNIKWIDRAVYNSGTSQFRTLYATKPGKHQKKEYIQTHSLGSLPIKLDLSESDLFRRSLLMQVSKENLLLKTPEPATKQPKRIKLESPLEYESIDIDDVTVKQAIEFFYNSSINHPNNPSLRTTYQFRNTFGKGGIALDRNLSSICPCDESKTHDHDNPYLTVSGMLKKVYFHCRSCERSIRIGKLQKKIEEKFLYLRPKYDLEYDEPEMRPFKQHLSNGKRTISIQGAMGVGKTKSLMDLIFDISVELGRPAPFIILSSRKTFTNAITGRFNSNLIPRLRNQFPDYSINLENYLDHPGIQSFTLDLYPYLTIQLDSCFKLNKPDYMIALLDESEELLNQFFSSTIRDRLAECLTVFEMIMKQSTYVIAMDALLSERTVNVIRLLRGDNYVVCNHRKPAPRIAIRVPTKEVLIDLHAKFLDEGKSFYHWSSSGKFAKNFTDNLFVGQRSIIPYKLYNTETSEADMRALDDIDTAFLPFRAIIASPVLTVGASFNIIKFVVISFYATSHNSCSVRPMIQGIHRVRNITSNIIYYVCHGPKYLDYASLPLLLPSADPEELIRAMPDHRKRVQQFIDRYELQLKIVNASDWFVLDYIYYLQERYVNGMAFEDVLNKHLEICNYTLQIYLEESLGEKDEKRVDEVKELPKLYHDLPSLMKREFSLEQLSRGCVFNYEKVVGTYDEKILAILSYKERNRLISPLEKEIRQKYYFDRMVEKYLKKDSDPANFYDRYWSSDDTRRSMKYFFYLISGVDPIREKLSKATYTELITREVESLVTLKTIIDLLPLDKRRDLFVRMVTLSKDELDNYLGAYLEKHKKDIQTYWQIRNERVVSIYSLFRSIFKKMECDVKIVRNGKLQNITAIIIFPYEYLDCFNFDLNQNLNK